MPSSRLRAALALFGRAAAAAGRQQQQQHHHHALAGAALAASAAAPPLHATPTAARLPRFLLCRPFASEAAAAATQAAATSPATQKEEDYSHLPAYTLADVAKRDGLSGETNGDGKAASWLAIDGLVYDATPYLDEHPGGADPIILNAGTDASAEFAAVHTQAAREVLRRFVIGRLVEEEDEGDKEGVSAGAQGPAAAAATAAAGATEASAVALDPKRRVPMPLVSRRWVSPTSVLLRFALPGGPQQRAGLPTGQHVMVYFREPPPEDGAEGGETKEGELVARAYTPISRDADAGTLDLLVRVYRPNARFPKGGRLSQLLADCVPVEDGASSSSSSLPRVEFKGPVGHFRWLGEGGRFSLANAPPRRASRLLLVAGGSGITPCYQVIRAALEEGGDAAPMVSLVYGSPCPEEILLKEELDDLARRFPSAFSLHYTVDRVPGGAEAEAAWRAAGGGVGFVTRAALEQHGFSGKAEEGEEGERLALVCGPPVMLEQAVVPALKAMGFEGDRLVAF